MPPSRGKSYNQVMNEWAAQRSFVNRMRNRFLHPPFDAPWYGKAYGYGWRLVLLVFAGALVYAICLNQHLSGKGFQEQMAKQSETFLHGTNTKLGAFEFPLTGKGRVNLASLEMDGAAGSFFHRVDLENLAFDTDWGMFRKNWHIEQLTVAHMEVQVRSGVAGSETTTDPTKADPATDRDRVVIPQFKSSQAKRPSQVLGAGWGVSPDFSKLKIDSYNILSGTATWGYSTTNLGSMKNALVTLTQAEGGWRLQAKGGTFSQNWLVDLKTEQIEAEIGASEIVIKQAHFTGKKGGRFGFAGKVLLGEYPELDLEMGMVEVPMQEMLPEPFNRFFTAQCNGSGRINGSINKASGVVFQMRCELAGAGAAFNAEKKNPDEKGGNEAQVKGLLHHLPILRALAVAASQNELMQPNLTEGKFELITGGNAAKLQNIDLRAGSILRIRGDLECKENLMGPGSGGQVTCSASGHLYFGLADVLVGRMLPEIQENHFKILEDGMRWVKVKFENENGEALTKSVADDIMRMVVEAGKKPQI